MSTADILAELARSRAALAPAPEDNPAEADLFGLAARDAAIEDILAEMMAEPDAAFQPVSMLYQDFLVRCRIKRVTGESLIQRLLHAIEYHELLLTIGDFIDGPQGGKDAMATGLSQ